MEKRNNKKEQEEAILTNFICTYQKQIDKTAKFKILDIIEAKLMDSRYNGENPDFIVQFNGEYIGIELFQLSKTKFAPNYINLTGIKNAKNIDELHFLQEKNQNHMLIETEDLASVALERINDKINKVGNYIDFPIWLIGYVPRLYNLMLLSAYRDDKIIDNIILNISKKIIEDKKVCKIWLIEFSQENLLVEVK